MSRADHSSDQAEWRTSILVVAVLGATTLVLVGIEAAVLTGGWEATSLGKATPWTLLLTRVGAGAAVASYADAVGLPASRRAAHAVAGLLPFLDALMLWRLRRTAGRNDRATAAVHPRA